MGSFFRENWLWIVTPLVLILIAVAVLIMMADGNQDDRFHYDIM